jgi:hypothetical protein
MISDERFYGGAIFYGGFNNQTIELRRSRIGIYSFSFTGRVVTAQYAGDVRGGPVGMVGNVGGLNFKVRVTRDGSPVDTTVTPNHCVLIYADGDGLRCSAVRSLS